MTGNNNWRTVKSWFALQGTFVFCPSKSLLVNKNFIRSKVDSTRRQALDNIAQLAIEYDYLRKLFQSLNAEETIAWEGPSIWELCNESLQLSSRTTLGCLQEGKCTSLRGTIYSLFWTRIQPDELFLFILLIARSAANIMFEKLEDMLIQVERTVFHSL